MGLDMLELIMGIEEEFQIDIDDEKTAELLTVGDLYNLIVSELDNAHRLGRGKSWTKEEAWEAMCRVIVAQIGVKRAEINSEARIVADLGVD
ncbi:MAG TPA: hypothetical protein VN934_03510 [Candidatus Tumulicola sp.]|nr:hypothetical protein [Candidatus Tumulicola sp.]